MPGIVAGEDNTWAQRRDTEPDHFERVAADQPAKTLQTPKSIARYILQLCALPPAVTTGCVLPADPRL